AGGNRWAADAVVAVATCDEIASNLLRSAIFSKTDFRLRGIKIVDRNVFDFENDLAVRVETGRDEVFDHFLLAVDGDAAAAGQFKHIDAVRLSIEAQLEAVVTKAFAAHAVADAGFIEEIDCTLFENTGADTAFNVFAAVRFDDDGIDSLQM